MRERFQVVRPLGRGGMGEVLLARDLMTGSQCALKRLRPDVLSEPGLLSREFRILAGFHHPAVVRVFELGYAPDGCAWYTMEYVPGEPADVAVRANAHWLPFVATELASGLEALHAAGIVHGDLKPANVLVIPPHRNGSDSAGHQPAAVRIVDFGIAAFARPQVGTAGYAAPEVVQGGVPTFPSDLYGLGATLFALVTGREAFSGTASDRLRLQADGSPSARLLEEAGAPPALTALALRLMAQHPSDRPASAREVRIELQRILPGGRRPLSERLGTFVLVGRERELAHLQEWASLARTPIVVLSGDVGIGRTSLLEAFAARCVVAGNAVIRIDGTDAGDSRDFIRILLRHLAVLAGESADAIDGNAVLREILEQPVTGAAVPDLVAETASGWLHSARATITDHLLVVIDDAERLDGWGRALIRRLALEQGGWLKVLEARPDAIPLGNDERPLELSGQIAVLHLTPLDRPTSDRLIASRLGQSPPPAIASAIWGIAAGHPGLTIQLLQSAAEAGAILESEEGLHACEERLADLALPADLSAVRLGQLAAMPPETRDLVLSLAVLGGSARCEELSHLQPDMTADSIEALRASGLIRVSLDGRIGLNPPGLAEPLLEQADSKLRATLHRRALDLEGLDAAARFGHFVFGGDPNGALDCARAAWQESEHHAPAASAAALAESLGRGDSDVWHERAARQAWTNGRYDTAARHFERSLALSADESMRPVRLERLAAAWFRCGNLEGAGRAIADGLAAQPGPLQRARLLVTDAACRHARGDFREGLDVAEAAVETATACDEPETEGNAALTAGSILLGLGRVDEAICFTDRAAACYVRSGQVLGQARAAQLRALLLHRSGRPGEALEASSEAVELARQSRSRLALEECFMRRAQLCGELGRGADCVAGYRSALTIALEDGRGPGAAFATLNLAQYEGLSGRPREAIRLARRAIRLTRAYEPGFAFVAWRTLAQGLRALGQIGRAEFAATRALALAVPVASPEELAWCRVELCRALFELGRFTDIPMTPADALPATPGEAVLELTLGRAALRVDDRARAASALSRVDRAFGDRWTSYPQAIAIQLKAELALSEGRISDAIELLRSALAAFERIPAPHDRAMALLDAASLAMGPKPDGRVPAGDWLRQAVALFGAQGNRSRRIQAVQLEAEWLRQQVERRHSELDGDFLEKVGRLLHSLPDLAQLMQRAMQLAVEQFDASRGVLLAEDPASRSLGPVAQYGAENATSEREACRFSQRLVERVIDAGTGVLVDDAPTDPQSATESVADLAIRAMLCVPMFLHGRVVGAVYLDSHQPGAFGDADRRLLDGFAQLMAVALESSRATERLAHENQELRREQTSRVRAGLIGSSHALQNLERVIGKAAESNCVVLLTGETGTGKDLIARIIHDAGRRRGMPYVLVDCTNLPKDLAETELFGIVDHRASGVRRVIGRFQKAHRGTIFLNEIGDMPLAQQAKLLAVLTDDEVIPIGGDPVPIDVRVIAATNRNLEASVERGEFRADLFHRLNVLRLCLPPLRDRKGDIPELARHFASQVAGRDGYAPPELAPDFLADLMQRDWPGNVRELENYIESRMVMSESDVLHAETRKTDSPRPRRSASSPRRIKDELEALERRILIEELQRAAGNQSRAARALGLTEPTFRNKLAKHSINSRRNLRRF